MLTMESKYVLCRIARDPNLLGYCVPATLRDRVHLEGDVSRTVGERVLVVGDGAFAGRVALQLFPENDVSLLSSDGSLDRLERAQRLFLIDLEAEGELKLLRGAYIQGLESTGGGRCGVSIRGAMDCHVVFDRIVYCDERVVHPTRPSTFSLERELVQPGGRTNQPPVSPRGRCSRKRREREPGWPEPT